MCKCCRCQSLNISQKWSAAVVSSWSSSPSTLRSQEYPSSCHLNSADAKMNNFILHGHRCWLDPLQGARATKPQLICPLVA